MPSVLPDEVLQRIVDEFQVTSTRAELVQLALALPTPVSLALRTRPVLASSTSAQQYIRHIDEDKSIALFPRILTVQRGTAIRRRAAGRGRKAKHEEVEDAVTPEQLVQLAQRIKGLVELHLLEPGFDVLRRRQVDFVSNLPHLRSLSIVGRTGPADRGFSLHTVGQILQGLPNLADLALRNLYCYPTALAGLSPPASKLASFALFDTPFITSGQLHWLVKSSIYADSLRSLSFDVPPHMPPSHLASVKWAATPVTHLAVSSSRAKVVEGLPQHFPSLRQYAFRSPTTVDPHSLLRSCASSGSVEVIEDRSMRGGVVPLVWAEALLFARRQPGLANLRRLSLMAPRRMHKGFRVLEEVCDMLGIQLELYNANAETGEAPWVSAGCVAPAHPQSQFSAR
ncbi:hypothetical protein JCM3770_000887 [Rhodotorula araucariae]